MGDEFTTNLTEVDYNDLCSLVWPMELQVAQIDKLREVQGIWLSQGFKFSDEPELNCFFVQRENGATLLALIITVDISVFSYLQVRWHDSHSSYDGCNPPICDIVRSAIIFSYGNANAAMTQDHVAC